MCHIPPYRAIAIATANPALAALEFASTKVTILDKAAFLFVPPAPSSTTIKSDVVKSAPISVAPSMFKADTETLELKMAEQILKERPTIEGLNWVLKIVSVVAPLMGLFGTIIGMIETFTMITLFGTGDPKTMASGISVALVTTWLGSVSYTHLRAHETG